MRYTVTFCKPYKTRNSKSYSVYTNSRKTAQKLFDALMYTHFVYIADTTITDDDPTICRNF